MESYMSRSGVRRFGLPSMESQVLCRLGRPSMESRMSGSACRFGPPSMESHVSGKDWSMLVSGVMLHVLCVCVSNDFFGDSNWLPRFSAVDASVLLRSFKEDWLRLCAGSKENFTW